MNTAYDELIAYCRMLGHEVPFRYCRTVNANLPCRNVIDCWSGSFDVADYIAREYLPSEQDQIFKQPPHKLTTIVTLIQKAREKG